MSLARTERRSPTVQDDHKRNGGAARMHLYGVIFCLLKSSGSCSGIDGAPKAGEYRLRTTSAPDIQTGVQIVKHGRKPKKGVYDG